MNRLMSLCELFISKDVERATKDSIEKADVNIIGHSFIVVSANYYSYLYPVVKVIHVHVAV